MSVQGVLTPEVGRSDRQSADSVSAFVVTYRRPELLAATLRGVVAQTRLPDAVIVINNDPADDVRVRVGSEFPGVEVLDMGGNEGSGGGFACALEMASRLGYTWSWLLDDDSIPDATSLEALLEAVGRLRGLDRAHAIAASTQVSPQGTFGGGRWRHRVIPVPVSERNGSEPYSVDVAYWAGLLVHRSVMERIGFPRADFFRCFADYEYCLRVRRAGIKIVGVPASRVAHHTAMYRASVRLGRRSVRLAYEPARHYYAARNEAYTAWRILRNPLAVAFFLGRQIRLGVGDLLHEERPLHRVRLRFLGALDGLRGRLGRREEIE